MVPEQDLKDKNSRNKKKTILIAPAILLVLVVVVGLVWFFVRGSSSNQSDQVQNVQEKVQLEEVEVNGVDHMSIEEIKSLDFSDDDKYIELVKAGQSQYYLGDNQAAFEYMRAAIDFAEQNLPDSPENIWEAQRLYIILLKDAGEDQRASEVESSLSSEARLHIEAKLKQIEQENKEAQ